MDSFPSAGGAEGTSGDAQRASGDAEGASGDVVRASGGVVWRRADGGQVEVLVVHRPKYDDWTFPKGKLGPGESDEDAAVREVKEETGLGCRLGEELESTSYTDGQGRSKVVRYWAMEPVAGEFRANPEVDQVRWVPVTEAATLLTYDRDHGLTENFWEVVGQARP